MQLILASQSLGRKRLLELLHIPFQIIPSKLDEDKIVGETSLETIKLRAKLKGEEVVRKITQSTNNPITQLSNTTRRYALDDRRYVILSADSGVIFHDQLIGKPRDYEDAIRILQTLSGRTHELVTAVYMIKMKQFYNDTMFQKRKTLSSLENCNIVTLAHSYVTFKKLSLTTIKRYLADSDYQRYAGGYALFDHPELLKPTLSDLLSDKSYKSILKPVDPRFHNRHLESLDLIASIQGSISNVIGLPLEKVMPILRYLSEQSLQAKR